VARCLHGMVSAARGGILRSAFAVEVNVALGNSAPGLSRYPSARRPCARATAEMAASSEGKISQQHYKFRRDANELQAQRAHARQ
jgi:hypothetical protein